MEVLKADLTDIVRLLSRPAFRYDFTGKVHCLHTYSSSSNSSRGWIRLFCCKPVHWELLAAKLLCVPHPVVLPPNA